MVGPVEVRGRSEIAVRRKERLFKVSVGWCDFLVLSRLLILGM